MLRARYHREQNRTEQSSVHGKGLPVLWNILLFCPFFFSSAVILVIMLAWHARLGLISLRSTTWRLLAMKAWTWLRAPWTTWTPAVTSTRSWTCTTRCSVLPCASSICLTWEMRWGSWIEPLHLIWSSLCVCVADWRNSSYSDVLTFLRCVVLNTGYLQWKWRKYIERFHYKSMERHRHTNYMYIKIINMIVKVVSKYLPLAYIWFWIYACHTGSLFT